MKGLSVSCCKGQGFLGAVNLQSTESSSFGVRFVGVICIGGACRNPKLRNTQLAPLAYRSECALPIKTDGLAAKAPPASAVMFAPTLSRHPSLLCFHTSP